MRKLFLLSGLLFVLSLPVSAQQKKTVFLHEKATMTELGLNEDQQTKITGLTKQSFIDIGKIKRDSTLSESQKKSGIVKVYQQRQKDYEAALTSEQLKKYNELKEAAKNQ